MVRGEQYRRAQTLCQTCPGISDCSEYALFVIDNDARIKGSGIGFIAGHTPRWWRKHYTVLKRRHEDALKAQQELPQPRQGVVCIGSAGDPQPVRVEIRRR